MIAHEHPRTNRTTALVASKSRDLSVANFTMLKIPYLACNIYVRFFD